MREKWDSGQASYQTKMDQQFDLETTMSMPEEKPSDAFKPNLFKDFFLEVEQ